MPMPTAEEIAKCRFCSQQMQEPLTLPCTHSYCSKCLHANMKQGKILCPACRSEHTVPNGNIEKAYKTSELTKFLIMCDKDHFQTVEPTEDEKRETEGRCLECTPIVPVKKNKDGSMPPEPLPKKLMKCYHCKADLCEGCRLKHYDMQRQEASRVLQNYQEGASNIAITTEKLNDARQQKIQSYMQMKVDMNAKKQEVLKKIETEEQALLKQIDDEIKEENEHIATSKVEYTKLTASRDTAKQLRENILAEKNQKRLAEFCNEFSKAYVEWKEQLSGDANRLDPKKEMKLVFVPSKYKDEMIGKLDKEKAGLKIDQPVIPGEKSKVCVIQ